MNKKSALAFILLFASFFSYAQHCAPAANELANWDVQTMQNSEEKTMLRIYFDQYRESGPDIDSFQVYLLVYDVDDEDAAFKLMPADSGNNSKTFVSANLFDEEVFMLLRKTVTRMTDTVYGKYHEKIEVYPFRWEVPADSIFERIVEWNQKPSADYRFAVYIPHTEDSLRSHDVPQVHDCFGLFYILFDPLPYTITLRMDSTSQKGSRTVNTPHQAVLEKIKYKPNLLSRHHRREKLERRRVKKEVVQMLNERW